MGLPNRLNMVHTVGGGATFTSTLPMKMWTAGHQLIGGGEKSAAGVPANYVITEEPTIMLEVRILEGTEQSDFVTFIKTVDAAAAAVTIKLDADVATTIVMYLESPSVRNNERIQPSGHDDDPAVLLYQTTWRRTTTGVLAPAYFT